MLAKLFLLMSILNTPVCVELGATNRRWSWDGVWTKSNMCNSKPGLVAHWSVYTTVLKTFILDALTGVIYLLQYMWRKTNFREFKYWRLFKDRPSSGSFPLLVQKKKSRHTHMDTDKSTPVQGEKGIKDCRLVPLCFLLSCADEMKL